MRSLIELVLLLLRLYGWCIIAVAVMSWLLAFGVINAYSPFVRSILEVLYRLTEPLLPRDSCRSWFLGRPPNTPLPLKQYLKPRFLSLFSLIAVFHTQKAPRTHLSP